MPLNEFQLGEHLAWSLIVGFTVGVSLFGVFWFIWLRPLGRSAKSDVGKGDKASRRASQVRATEDNVVGRIVNFLTKEFGDNLRCELSREDKGTRIISVTQFPFTNPSLRFRVTVGEDPSNRWVTVCWGAWGMMGGPLTDDGIQEVLTEASRMIRYGLTGKLF